MEETKKPKQRTFRGFIYEFFVVFIAVTLGFLADNYRENLADSEKERQYADNLVRDLKKDTTILSELIISNQTKQIRLDSFVMLRYLDFNKAGNLKTFYSKAWASEMYLVHLFRSNQATLYQLKSTGDLRLIRQKDVAEKVLEYDLSFQSMLEGEKYYSNHTEETWRLMYQLTPDLNRAVQWYSDKYDPPRIDDTKKLDLFFNLTQDLSWTVGGYVGRLENQKALASDLITILKERYNLTDEAASR
jgi:hypothetical protein